MYCSNCNATYSTESLFCPLCGQRMSASPCALTLHNASNQALSSTAPFIYSRSEQAFDASAPLEAASLQELYASDLSSFESSITSTTSPCYKTPPTQTYNAPPARTHATPTSSPTPAPASSSTPAPVPMHMPISPAASSSAATYTSPAASAYAPTPSRVAASTPAATSSASALSEQAFAPPGIDAYTAQSNKRTHALYLKQALDTLYEPTSTDQTGILPGDISASTPQNNGVTSVTSVSNAPPYPESNTGNRLTRWMHTLSKKASPPAEINTTHTMETSRCSLRSLQAIVVSVALCWPLGLYKLWRSKTPFTTRMKALTSVCFLVQSALAITLLAVCSPYVIEQQPFAFVRAYALDKLNAQQHTNSAQHGYERSKNGNATSTNGNNYGKAHFPDNATGSNANAILGINKGSNSANAANGTSGNNSANGINGTGGSGFGQSQGSAHATNDASAQNMARRSASAFRTNADDNTLRFDDQGILRLASFARVKQSNIYPALTRAGFRYQPKLGSWCNAAENCALTIRRPDGHVIDAETLQNSSSIPCEKAYVYVECKTPFESLDAFGTCMTSEYEGVSSTYDNGTTHSYRIDTNSDLSAFMTLTKKGDMYCGMLTWIKAPPL